MSGQSTDKVLRDAGLTVSQRQATDGAPEFHVAGDTHPHRHLLRQAGGAWDKLKRVWKFADADPSAALAEAIGTNPPEPGLADSAPEKPHYWGHRERLRGRFMDNPDGLADYELLELLLFYSIPRRDVKPLAKHLIERFGGFGGVLAAEPERLAELDEVTYATIVQLKAVHAAALKAGREDISDGTVLDSWDRLIAYCKAGLGHDKRERFCVLFLNARNALIADEVMHEGTVNHTPVYPREVVKRALELGATALIMVHNHPSGDPTPSQADIDMTHEVAEAGDKLGIVLHDHVVVTADGDSSFKEMGLL